MGHKLDNVLAFYRDGVGDGHLQPAADKYLAPDYVDHRPPGGIACLLAIYEPLLARYPDRLVLPLRAFEDGSRVFLHSFQTFGRGQRCWVGLEVFDTDEADTIVHRRGARVPLASWSRSGRSQIDGPTHVTDTDRTVANKAVVTGFLTEVLGRGDRGAVHRFLGGTYAEHSPDVPDGPAGLLHHLEEHEAMGLPIRYGPADLVVGCGNFVVAQSPVTAGPLTYEALDLYRLEHGRIVEHWDARPPRHTDA
jgi:predicted SnoaL-like aldol condensation-catalyzing enzyme